MAKVIKFPVSPAEKFGFRPARRRKTEQQEKLGQLNLFSGGKLVSLSARTPFEEALYLDDLGDKHARVLYEKAIALGDSPSDAYCNLGILESKDQNYTRAIDCFTKCLAESPRHFEAHYNLANLYAEIGNFPLAKIHYQFSIEIEPEFPNSFFNLALTQAMLREVEEAIITLNTYRTMVNQQERQQADHLIQSLLNARV
jgi:tetratricopeptide (TPR) repeat protein